MEYYANLTIRVDRRAYMALCDLRDHWGLATFNETVRRLIGDAARHEGLRLAPVPKPDDWEGE